jgi:dinuclear metal center YbgI/SA1388 family protein
MTKVRDLTRWLDTFAPFKSAESWDNVGLLWGDPDATINRVMTCLTVTANVAAEAIAEQAQAIVSHHPVLFRPVKKLIAGHPENGFLWDLARAGVSILSPHTAFDNTEGGINDGLALRLGLTNVRPLRPFTPASSCKIVVFTPESDGEAMLSAAFNAGAGRIGAYEQCSFAIPGHGTFFGGEGSNPTVGQAGRRESVEELRIELVCPADRLPEALAAIRAAHSYEEPAIDVYPLQVGPSQIGAGRIGRLAQPTSLEALAWLVERDLDAPGLQFVGEPGREVSRVAIVCGAGDDFLPDAHRAGADVLLTGEARFHRALEAEALGIGMIVAGHHATERPGVEGLATRIGREFSGVTVWASRKERDPLRSLAGSARGL